MRGSLMGEVDAVIRRLGRATVDDLVREVDEARIPRSHRPLRGRIWSALRDLVRAGRVRRVGRAEYACAAPRGQAAAPGRDRMWRVLRARRVVRPEDLAELAEVSEAYAREFLGALRRQKVVAPLGDGRWRLTDDPVVMPEDHARAERLREWRRRLLGIAAAVDRAEQAVAEALAEVEGAHAGR
jgi:aryl-alcohol dehydrogenase-like predicted oxidoreductase